MWFDFNERDFDIGGGFSLCLFEFGLSETRGGCLISQLVKICAIVASEGD